MALAALIFVGLADVVFFAIVHASNVGGRDEGTNSFSSRGRQATMNLGTAESGPGLLQCLARRDFAT